MMLLKHVTLLIAAIVTVTADEGSTPQPKSKRQIYREQVLPSRGGKIPDAAFQTDRLALNRLNKEGISIPDGVLLEHRNVHNHPHLNQYDPEDEDSLVKVVQKPEDRFVAPPGKYYNKKPLTVASTYLIRKPVGAEGAALRPPIPQQVPTFAFNQPYGHQLFNSLPVEYYQQRWKVPTDFPTLPQELTAPPVDFVQNTRFPVPKYKEPQVPTNKYLPVEQPGLKYLPVQQKLPPKKYLPQGYPGTVVHHPHPHGYEPSISYQSVSYYPVIRPLELPNREVLKKDYYQVQSPTVQPVSVGGPVDDVHAVVNWPALLQQYTQISENLNGLNQNVYGVPAPAPTPAQAQAQAPYSKFLFPQVPGSGHSSPGHYYPPNVGRYARKSKEVSLGELDGTAKRLGDPGRADQSNRLSRCGTGLENAVDC